MPKLPDSLPPEILTALREGRQLEAIKLLRKTTGLGLAETKSLIDSFLRSQAPVQAKAKAVNPLKIAVHAPKPRVAVHIPQRISGLSPGEVPRDSGGPWLLLVVIGAMIAAWLIYR